MTKQMVCAGGGDRDTCEGDSGGGLVISDGKSSYLEGIVSWGKGCGGREGVGVYTRVPSYVKWIRMHAR